ncbi:hypothetical protein ACGFYV_37315, partial [Streptomyces sp. NPDC048297]
MNGAPESLTDELAPVPQAAPHATDARQDAGPQTVADAVSRAEADAGPQRQADANPQAEAVDAPARDTADAPARDTADAPARDTGQEPLITQTVIEAAHEPQPVSTVTSDEWKRRLDERDDTLLFAPPADLVHASFKQSAGPVTFELPDERLYSAVRTAILSGVPRSRRDAARREIDDWFLSESFVTELPQAISDRLVLTLFPADRPLEVSVRLRLGDWRQVTDTHGRPIGDPSGAVDPVSERREARTRQVFESGDSVASSSTVAHGMGLPASLLINHAFSAVPHLNKLGGLVNSAIAGYSASSTSDVSSTAATARYTKGTYRAVDFAYDVLYDVTVRGRGQTDYQSQEILEAALVGRHDRRAVRSRPKPSENVVAATSGQWRTWQSEDAPATGGTQQPDVSTDMLRQGMEAAEERRTRARAGDGAFDEWDPRVLADAADTSDAPEGAVATSQDDDGRGAVTATADPSGVSERPEGAVATSQGDDGRGAAIETADTSDAPERPEGVVATSQGDDGRGVSTTGRLVPLAVPRTSLVETFDHTEDLRRAVFSVLPHEASEIGSVQRAAVHAFTSSQSIAGSLHQAMTGGHWSPLFHFSSGGPLAVELRTMFHDADVVEADGGDEVDWLTHLDTEDTLVDNVAHRRSAGDGGGYSGSALWDSSNGKFSTLVGLPVLGARRAVSISDPGQQAGSVVLHKVKLEEATVVVEGRTRTEVRSTGGRSAVVEGRARLRILLKDAQRLGLLRAPAPDPTVSGPKADDVELHARTSPDRRLRINPAFGSWLPHLSRVASLDSSDTRALFDRVLNAVHNAAPGMLPDNLGTEGAQAIHDAGGRSAAQLANFLKVASLVRGESLAARLHDMINGGVSVLLSVPRATGPQEVTLELSASFTPDDFTQSGLWDGNMETYYGNFYELQGDRSTVTAVEGGFDAPFWYNRPPQDRILHSVGARIEQRLGATWVSTTGGGFSAGGASGGGSRFMGVFDGRVDIRFKVSTGTDNRAATGAAVTSAAVTWALSATSAIGMTTMAPYPGTVSTSGTTNQPADSEAARSNQLADPVTVHVSLLVADDLLEEKGPGDEWYDSVRMRSRLDRDRLAYRELTGEEEVPPAFQPANDERPPLHSLLLAQTGGLRGQADDLLAELDLTLEPSDRVSLHATLNALGPRVGDFIGGSYPLWNRVVGRDSFGLPRRLVFELQASIGTMTTKGVSRGAYQYDHTLTTAAVSDSTTSDTLAFGLAGGGNAAFAAGVHRDAASHVPVADTVVPSLGLRYANEAPMTFSSAREGQSDRVDITLGAQEIVHAQMVYRLTAKVWSESPVNLGGLARNQHIGERTGHRTLPNAPAVMVMPVARAAEMRYRSEIRRAVTAAQGQAPAPAPVRSVTTGADPTSAPEAPEAPLSPWTSTDRPGPVDGALPLTLPTDGLGHGTLFEIPDLRASVEASRDTLFSVLDADHAELVLARLRSLASRQGTKAGLEPMTSGVLRFVVPYRGPISTALAVVTARIELTNPVHLRDAGEGHVVEGKNVQRDTQSLSSGQSQSWSGRAGLGYGNGPVVSDGVLLRGSGAGAGFAATYGQGQGLGAATGRSRSSGMLNVDWGPALISYDVAVNVELERYWGLTASTALVGPLLTHVGAHSRHTLIDTSLGQALTLSYPQQLMGAEDDPSPLPRPAPVALPAHETGPRTSVRPAPEQLTEAFLGTVAGLRDLLREAETLVGTESRTLGQTSWHGAKAHLTTRLATVFSLAWMHQRALHLIAGGEIRVPLTLPGVFANSEPTLVLSLDHDGVSVAQGPGDGAVTGTLVKDFRRAHRAVDHSVNAALDLRGSASGRIDFGAWGNDITRPGAGVDAGRTAAAGQRGGFGNLLEGGDKSAGTRGEGLADPDQRRFTRLALENARWNIGLVQTDGTRSGVQVNVLSEALTLFVPEERTPALLELTPQTIDEPIVGAEAREESESDSDDMPGGWPTNPPPTPTTQPDATDATEPQEQHQAAAEVPAGTVDAESDGAPEDSEGSETLSENARGKLRDRDETGDPSPEAAPDPERLFAEEFADSGLSDLGMAVLARLRREAPDSWQKDLLNASAFLGLPLVSPDRMTAHHEATVLTAVALRDSGDETRALVDHHASRRPDKGDPPPAATSLLAALNVALTGLPVGEQRRVGGSRPAADVPGPDEPVASGSGLSAVREPADV